MLKGSYSGNYNQSHCTKHGIYLTVLSFLTIFSRKLAMELNIHMHESINNANQVIHIKTIKFSTILCKFPCFQG